MKMWMLGLAAAASLFVVKSAEAFPPTATVSPGYDRALAESRRARGAEQPNVVAPAPRYVQPRIHKRKYRH